MDGAMFEPGTSAGAVSLDLIPDDPKLGEMALAEDPGVRRWNFTSGKLAANIDGLAPRPS